jgi:hypothetical protein
VDAILIGTAGVWRERRGGHRMAAKRNKTKQKVGNVCAMK